MQNPSFLFIHMEYCPEIVKTVWTSSSFTLSLLNQLTGSVKQGCSIVNFINFMWISKIFLAYLKHFSYNSTFEDLHAEYFCERGKTTKLQFFWFNFTLPTIEKKSSNLIIDGDTKIYSNSVKIESIHFQNCHFSTP